MRRWGGLRAGFPLLEARAVSATCGGIRVQSVYVPNGRGPIRTTMYKWTGWQRSPSTLGRSASRPRSSFGDMNIAPADEDVFDRGYAARPHVPHRSGRRWRGCRRLACETWSRSLAGQASVYVLDYPRWHVPSGLGYAIDLVLATVPVAERVRAAWVDRRRARVSGPSDHARWSLIWTRLPTAISAHGPAAVRAATRG